MLSISEAKKKTVSNTHFSNCWFIYRCLRQSTRRQASIEFVCQIKRPNKHCQSFNYSTQCLLDRPANIFKSQIQRIHSRHEVKVRPPKKKKLFYLFFATWWFIDLKRSLSRNSNGIIAPHMMYSDTWDSINNHRDADDEIAIEGSLLWRRHLLDDLHTFTQSIQAINSCTREANSTVSWILIITAFLLLYLPSFKLHFKFSVQFV